MTELLLFAKFWEPGRVKTRLAQVLGEAAAAATYRLFFDACLKRLATTGERRTVVFWPPEEREVFERVAIHQGWQCQPQAVGDLGDRMHAAMSRALDAGADAVVLLGSDSPNLPVEYVRRAIELLQQVEIVLGPAADGGYYLFATRLNRREFFEGVEWSSSRVLEQTLERIRQLQPLPQWALLPAWYDVDEDADLRRLWADLRRMPPSELREAALQSLASWLGELYGEVGDSQTPDMAP